MLGERLNHCAEEIRIPNNTTVVEQLNASAQVVSTSTIPTSSMLGERLNHCAEETRIPNKATVVEQLNASAQVVSTSTIQNSRMVGEQLNRAEETRIPNNTTVLEWPNASTQVVATIPSTTMTIPNTSTAEQRLNHSNSFHSANVHGQKSSLHDLSKPSESRVSK
jgi:hypothetical protein